jgi:hypothetical protein
MKQNCKLLRLAWKNWENIQLGLPQILEETKRQIMRN